MFLSDKPLGENSASTLAPQIESLLIPRFVRTGGTLSEVSADIFFKRVIENIRKVPSGSVATYGQIARLSGKPHGSRAVSWILHSSSRKYKLPWHRIINAQGKISFDKRSSNYVVQKRRLMREGVEFSFNEKIDLKTYQYLGPQHP